MPDDPVLETSAITPADHAFAASGTHTFLDRPLEPFSVGMQLAAQALGNRLLCGRIAAEQGGFYDGMAFDVAALIFLLTSGRPAAQRAIAQPEKTRAEVLEFAEREKFSIGSEPYRDGVRVYWAIIAELNAAQFRAGSLSEDGSPNA